MRTPGSHSWTSPKNLNGFPRLFDIAFLLQNMETTFVAEEKPVFGWGHFYL
jgi:hypothetical protein